MVISLLISPFIFANEKEAKICADIEDAKLRLSCYDSLFRIYQIEDPKELSCEMNNGWNGKHYEIQKDLPSDTYVYQIYFQDLDGWKHTEYGTILLVR